MHTNKRKNIGDTSGKFHIFEWMINFKEQYGILNIITAGLLLLFMSMVMTVVMNPSIIFDKYREYDEFKHAQSFNYRMKTNKAMQLTLKDIIEDMNGYRCFVIELHNGKQNSTGLSFNYGALTYEVLRNDSVPSVAEDYADFTLDRYPILMKVHEEGYWCGTTEEMKQYDRRTAMKLESNDAYGIALTTIYGVKSEIGYLGVTFNDTTRKCNREVVANKMRKFAAQIAPLLDGENAN